MAKKNVLTLGTGKNKRQWELSEKEFAHFEALFEECEIVDMSDFDPTKWKLTKVPAPARK